MVGPKEVDFESLICESLVSSGGYVEWKVGVGQGSPTDFDPVSALDTAELFSFIGATQAKQWADLVQRQGGDPDAAQKAFVGRLAKRLDELGTVEVLRHGVEHLGVTIKLAFFAPATSLNPEAQAMFEANRLTVTRQLPFDPGSTKTLDLCLFVNGLPVATAELKTHLTGQTSADAKTQYDKDRDPNNLLLRRSIVHFAVDTEVAWMTTRLAGSNTRWFHFNQGRNEGAGNSDNPDGVRTAYLWESVWSRDAWLDILGRFVHVEKPAKGRPNSEGTVIFPRFQQRDAVLACSAHAAEHGPGHNYLVQHSAGSGKSKTIAWLAHRLSNLHASDKKVFDKVIIITDRRVLDRQLQEQVAEFERVAGVVRKIDEDSTQLAEALEGEQARVVITTIQKFPFVIEKIGELAGRTYAVIADEAHSSQSGETAKDLKVVLGGASNEEVLAGFESEELGDISEVPDPVQDKLASQVEGRGRQSNLSFFAFTATPKAKTLELFGTQDGVDDEGRSVYVPFHLYSMRQAIQEGYIHDVLANYTTYQTFWEIEQVTPEDPEYDPARAKAAIAKYVSLHEHNLAQKADIIINHFRERVARKVGGQAKAMVVTASRLHALRYGLALRKYCDDHGIGDVGVLVAFSGTLQDNGIDYTESKLNGFGESQTPQRFDSDDFQILVVAEKYQTGFDQPKLHTMYVDKPLSGLAAVQTLSRLNRTHPAKDDTFVLDFRNAAESIRDSFAKWYVQTSVPQTDPNLMYDTHHQVTRYDVLRHEEVETFIYVLMDDPKATDRIHATLEGAKGRFWEVLTEDEQQSFREDLKKFTSSYGYLAQIVSFGDIKLERDYLFCRALAPFIRPASEPLPDVTDKVNLAALAIRMEAEEESISLPDDEGELSGPGEIFGRPGVPEMETLSEIIRLLNERYGTNFDPEDRLIIQGMVEQLVARPDVQASAAANDLAGFKIALGEPVEDAVLGQMDAAAEFGKQYLDTEGFASDVLRQYMPLLQTKAKIAHQEHCPIGELLAAKESDWLEFKSTFHVTDVDGTPHKGVETAAIKSVAAFLNSYDGGTLLLGVAEDDDGRGVPFGLEGDYAQFRKDGKDDEDQFLRALTDKLTNSMGAAAVTNLSAKVLTVDGKDICRVHVKPSGFPVEAKVTIIDKKGQHVKQTNRYVRLPNKTHKFTNDEEWEKFKSSRWPGAAQ